MILYTGEDPTAELLTSLTNTKKQLLREEGALTHMRRLLFEAAQACVEPAGYFHTFDALLMRLIHFETTWYVHTHTHTYNTFSLFCKTHVTVCMYLIIALMFISKNKQLASLTFLQQPNLSIISSSSSSYYMYVGSILEFN